jgi:hypothetical protein
MVMKWFAFYIIYRRNFPSIRGGHREDFFHFAFCFATLLCNFALQLCFLLLLFAWVLHSAFATLKKLGGPWKTLAGLKISAENFGASQNFRRT